MLTTSATFDCNAGYSNWMDGWSSAKAMWCCRHAKRGCLANLTTPALPYDCDSGFSNWRIGWSDAKMVWCCSYAKRGCKSTTTTSARFDCSTSHADAIAVSDWPTEK